MSIASLSRVVLIGPVADQRAILSDLQALGVMHIDGLDEAIRGASASGDAEGARARLALRSLSRAPRVRVQLRDDPDFDLDAFVARVLDNREQRRSLRDAIELVDKRIDVVARWGRFDLPEHPSAIGARLWFYEAPIGELARFESLDRPWHVVHEVGSMAYVVVVGGDSEPPSKQTGGVRAHIGRHGLDRLQAERATLEAELDRLDHEREGLTRKMSLLARDLARADDAGALRLALALASREDAVFTISGWIARDDEAVIAQLAEDRQVAVWIGAPRAAETPPTLLRPPEPTAAGADLARMYQLPGAREWDPSTALFVSFSLFFAVILSDVGYALVLLALGVLAGPAMRKRPIGKRLHALWMTAGLCSAVWGVLAGSYFGAGPPHPWLAAAQIISLNDYSAMMTVTVLIGAAHVGFANLAAAFARRRSISALTPLGWAVLIVAGCVWWFAPDARAFAYAGAAAAALLIVVGAGGPLRGLVALTKATALLADVLSYLRLFALGLASASLAMAFNDLAVQARDAAGTLGLPAFALILLAGHGLNLCLSVAGGVVHGLRLNLIEFYNWGVGEEGKPFTPFARATHGDG